MELRIAPFGPGTLADFLELHCDENDAGWCRCVAWWVPTWEGWAERSAGDNTTLRESLCARGEWDGLLAFDGDRAVGWCQVGRRDRLDKLVAQLELSPDPSVWCVSCFLVAPSHRGRGVAGELLAAAAERARAAGAERLEGYPREGGGLDEGEVWTGPASLFAAAGFELARAGTPRSVVSLDLTRPG